MLYRKKLILICILAIWPFATSVDAQEVQLIANLDIQADSLSASDVKDIFLGEKTLWDDGGKITFFISNEKAAHNAFLKNYVGKSASQFNKIWRQRIFGGRGKAPKSSDSDKEMIRLVSKTKGSIGYVSAGADIGGVKKLSLK